MDQAICANGLQRGLHTVDSTVNRIDPVDGVDTVDTVDQ